MKQSFRNFVSNNSVSMLALFGIILIISFIKSALIFFTISHALYAGKTMFSSQNIFEKFLMFFILALQSLASIINLGVPIMPSYCQYIFTVAAILIHVGAKEANSDNRYSKLSHSW